ncbi:DUF5819 family protein [Streptomyces sp. TRM75563]|uniref:DUF5819 family protein n=1 Tax=Streptomyces sp. TRM75563 TaxID=2817418 RepID=UPI001F606E54|nr:DUF5819 family protein [Streptomyces sp. TRM75563]MCI4046579.1 DUF5819 family protein [Streptomyces sp. TRM75563]
MVIDGERGGMDSDHDRSSAGGGKDAWPQALNRPAEARNTPEAIPATPSEPVAEPSDTGRGIAGLSFPYQVVAALALSLIGLLACTQVAMVFLHVAPSNTLTKQHGKSIDRWIYPEFEQNWKLFAPNPLQQNVAVHVRADVVGADGRHTTRWMNLTHEDGEAIRGSLFPSHVAQNELRRGWDFYVNSHDSENRPNGLRGDLSERYVRRIAMLRLSERDYGGTIERIQLRSATSSIAPPPWSNEKISTRPVYRVLPWWTVTPDDLPERGAEQRAAEQRDTAHGVEENR